MNKFEVGLLDKDGWLISKKDIKQLHEQDLLNGIVIGNFIILQDKISVRFNKIRFFAYESYTNKDIILNSYSEVLDFIEKNKIANFDYKMQNRS